jgi:serine/threonine-protein kinase
VGDAVHIVLDIARALEHAHSRNVVHRDIKPGNILIAKSGLAKLSDLGLAKRTDEASHLTLTRQGFGTPYYMPYEQAMNARRADARSDIYALGATLYHLLTGEVPFSGANALEIVDKKGIGEFLPASLHNPAVTPELDRILEKMMAREPQDRYQTASELIVELERSGLAAAVPSFIDQAEALNDPLVRERLTAPAQATVLDMRHGGPAQLFWYVVYRDGRGKLAKGKMTTALVRKRLEAGKLRPQARAARAPKGPYLPLHAIRDFDDVAPPALLRAPRKLPKLVPLPAENEVLTRGWWFLSLTLIIATLGILSAALLAWNG